MERRDRLRGLRPDLVLDRDGADEASVGDHAQDRPALARPGVRRRGETVPGDDAELPEQARAADLHVDPVHGRARAAAGERLERRPAAGAIPRSCARRRRWHGPADAPSPPRPTRPAAAAPPRRCRRPSATAGQRRLAPRERARLVEDDHVQLARPLERDPVLDQQPVAGAERGRDRDHQRDRQAQGVRAGDDQHGRRAHQRALGVTQEPPAHERDRAGASAT